MVKVVCRICLDFFDARPSNVARGWGLYCSRRCKGKGRTRSIMQSRLIRDQPDNYKLVPISNGEPALVSNEDYDAALLKTWHRTRDGYIRDRSSVFLHQLVLERMLGRSVRQGYLPDHVDRNPSNNRRSNLRELTESQNVQNRGVFRNSKSGYKGVKCRSKSGYVAYVKSNGVLVSITGFKDPVEAAYVRDQIAMQIHGPHTYLNFEY